MVEQEEPGCIPGSFRQQRLFYLPLSKLMRKLCWTQLSAKTHRIGISLTVPQTSITYDHL